MAFSLLLCKLRTLSKDPNALTTTTMPSIFVAMPLCLYNCYSSESSPKLSYIGRPLFDVKSCSHKLCSMRIMAMYSWQLGLPSKNVSKFNQLISKVQICEMGASLLSLRRSCNAIGASMQLQPLVLHIHNCKNREKLATEGIRQHS